MSPYDDEDDERDDILQGLSGEVDDFAGSKLKDPSAPDANQGVTIEISVKPHGAAGEPEEKPSPEGMEAGSEEHDPIAHILGMCRGGCAY